MLLLVPCLALAAGSAAATTYKCVVKGVTTYSQDPCGKNAKKVDTTDALAGVGVPTPVPAGAQTPPPAGRAGRSATKPASRPTAKADDNSCAARIKAYHDSLACFAPYRHNANVVDVEAYKHCKVVAEPTDCESDGL